MSLTKKILLVIAPFVSWILFGIIIVVLFRVIFQFWMPWWAIIILYFVSFFMLAIVTYIVYDFFGFFNYILSSEDVIEEMKVGEVDIVNIRKHLIEYYRRNPIQPVNLTYVKFALAGIKTIGQQKTEIYVDKLRNSAYGRFELYYIGVRAKDLTKKYYVTRSYQPSSQEENTLVNDICNNLAETPDKVIEIEQKIVKTSDGDTQVKIERIPISITRNPNEEQSGDVM